MNVRTLSCVMALALVACSSNTIRDPGPRIETLGDQEAPSQDELPIIESKPIENDPERALKNYQEILKLAPDAATRAEAKRRIADLQIDIEDLEPSANSEKRIRESIALYQSLLADDDTDNQRDDRVLYQLARAYQNIGEEAKSVATLKRLAEEHPDGDFTADGRFRRAELLFRLRRYDEAATEYRRVIELGDATPFFFNAQHMLGWSLYKQGDHDAALEILFGVLDANLPPGDLTDPEPSLAQVSAERRDLVADVLRVTGLTLIAQGGGKALGETLERRGEPRFYVLLYNALGAALLSRERFTDAAETYANFTQNYPRHPLAPRFQSQVIGALKQGGFSERVVEEKARYARAYDPDADYWGERKPTDEVLGELRTHLEDLARYRHARAPDIGPSEYQLAADWYARLLEIFPDDPDAPELNFLYADALLDAGATQQAAREYTKTAYDYPAHDRSAEAAYAAVLAWQQHATTLEPTERDAALRTAIDSGVRMADNFPDHPRAMAVLTRATEDLFVIKAYDEAIQIGRRVTQAVPPAPPTLQRTAWSVIADAEFTQQRFELAENAYEQVRTRTPDDPEARQQIGERIAESIYRQAEAAQAAGNDREAVRHFLRLGESVPDAGIRPNAEYDAASTLVSLEDWQQAAEVFEGFRTRFPSHQLLPDVDKQLTVVYQQSSRPADAADAFLRIAGRETEETQVRQAAAWRAAELFELAHRPVRAAQAWGSYVLAYPRPMDDAMDARLRLIELANERGDRGARRRWLDAIVEADAAAGDARSARSRTLAARASLILGRLDARYANTIKLTAPLKDSLPARRGALQSALSRYEQAIGYGFADITTAATYELGALYRVFASDLIDSERPNNLDALAAEQYELLLEEQAFPFEEQAIGYYETNLKRIDAGVYDHWIDISYDALLEMAPGLYGRRMKMERTYDSLQ